LPRIFRFAADVREGVGAVWDAATGRLFGSGGGWRAWVAGERPTSVRHTIAGGLDCRSASGKVFRLRRAPMAVVAGLFLHAQNYFWATATKTAIRPK